MPAGCVSIACRTCLKKIGRSLGRKAEVLNIIEQSTLLAEIHFASGGTVPDWEN